MTRIQLIIPGDPVPMPRARVVNGHAYTPPEAVAAKQRVAHAARLVQVPLFVGPLSIEVDVYLAGRVRFDKRGSGDWDNYAKLAADALEGIAYANDAAIISGTGRKHPADASGARMVIVLEGETGEPAPKKKRTLRLVEPKPSKDWKALASPASYRRNT